MVEAIPHHWVHRPEFGESHGAVLPDLTGVGSAEYGRRLDAAVAAGGPGLPAEQWAALVARSAPAPGA
ncbi:hypothetical protein ACIRBX_07550 [Kitasatospora sp. NPDC096147]|uniref:hypothetical protein n=1 Tax=Kitasatospora sp. NPDC096147 TaxID=3364093 RepID=UPI003828A1C3